MFREDGRTIYHYEHERKGKSWVLKEQKIDSTSLFQKMVEHNLLRTLLGIMIGDCRLEIVLMSRWVCALEVVVSSACTMTTTSLLRLEGCGRDDD